MAKNFFKGEKKKKKSNIDNKPIGAASGFSQPGAPTYTMPSVIEKKKSTY